MGGVTPKKGGSTHLGRPVFNSVEEAKAAVNPDASVVYVPPPFAAAAVLDSIKVSLPIQSTQSGQSACLSQLDIFFSVGFTSSAGDVILRYFRHKVVAIREYKNSVGASLTSVFCLISSRGVKRKVKVTALPHPTVLWVNLKKSAVDDNGATMAYGSESVSVHPNPPTEDEFRWCGGDSDPRRKSVGVD